MNKISLVLVALLLTSTLSMAQSPHFQQYFPLKNNRPLDVNTVFQDSKGFVWLGTASGLFRFDGINYLHYTKNDSLPDINITALAEDAAGRLWIGHRSGEISIMDGGLVQRFDTEEGPAVEPVSDILFDHTGRLWFSTLNDGLYYYEGKRLFRIDEQEGLPDPFVYDLYEDRNGNIWAGTDGGLARCSLTNGKAQIQVFDADDGLPDIIIRKIKGVDGDTLALATEDAGVVLFDIATTKAKPLSKSPWNYGTVSDHLVKEQQIWIASPGNGLLVYDRKSDHLKVFSDFEGGSLRAAKVLFKDSEGNVWTGMRNGLARTLGDAIEHLETLHPCTDTNILALAIDREDRMWFSSRQGLFVRSLKENGRTFVSRKLLETPYRDATIISLFADVDGYVWAGLYGDGLLRIDPRSDEVRHFRRELRNGNVLSIAGKGDSLWVATLGGSTLIQGADDDYTFTNYGSDDGLSSDFIYQVFIDGGGRVWFATDGKGVTMLDKDGFHHLEKGLGSTVVYGFAEDAQQRIWVSAQDNGIYRYESGEFAQVPQARLRDSNVQAMAADDLGNIVIMHNFGVDVFDTGAKKMRHWGEEIGIRDKRPNLNAVAKDEYGQLFFGTSRGIVKLSLRNDTTVVTPTPAIDAVKVFDDVVDIRKRPRLTYNENNITLHFLGFWYQNTQSLNYLYKLDNYDLEWIETRNQQVTYSRLPPGEYVFRVKVSDTDDFTHARETSVAFSISPPFWRTSTFYVFAIGMFVIGAYGLMKFRERKLLEDKFILEAKVEERTKEIQLKTEEIQAQNEEILAQAEEIQGINENLEMMVKERTAELEKKNQALEEYAFINAHKLRGPVASILGLLNLLSKSNPQGETKVLCDHLQQSAGKLDAVVRSITEAIEKADKKY